MSPGVCALAAMFATGAETSPAVPAADEIVVVSRKPASAASEHDIDGMRLRQSPARTAEDMLELVPGLHVVQHGAEGKGHQFFLRGFDAVHGSDVEVRVEGVPINEPSNVHGHGYVDLGFVVPELVERVHARKGAYALDQGDFATAGSAELRLGVAPEDRGLRLGHQVGTTGRHRALAVWAPGERDFVAAEGLIDDGYGEQRAAKRATFLGRLALLNDEAHRLEVLGAGYAARFELPGAVRLEDVRAGRIGFYDAYTDGTGGASDRALLTVIDERRDGPWRLRLQAFGGWRRLALDENYTGFLGDPAHGDRHEQTQDGIDGGLEARSTWRVFGPLQLRALLSTRLGRAEQRDVRATGDALRDLAFTQAAVAAGAGAGWRVAGWLRLEGALRFDAFRFDVDDRLADRRADGSATALSPRLAAVMRPHADWRVFAAYGRGLRSPEARAFAAAGDHENEPAAQYEGGEPEVTVADDAEVGVRFEPGADLSVGAALFGVHIARESLFDHASGVVVERGGTRRYGVEADVRVRPASWLELDADVTAADARFTSDGAAVPGAPRLLATTGASLVHPDGWRASTHALFIGRRPLAQGAQAGSAVFWDASAGYRWSWLELRLDVENLLALEHAESEAQYASHWDPGSTPSRIPVVHRFAAPPRNARLTATAFF